MAEYWMDEYGYSEFNRGVVAASLGRVETAEKLSSTTPSLGSEQTVRSP